MITDPRATFSRYVRADAALVHDRAPARKVPVTFRMVRRHRSGSLYGNVDILGKPTEHKGRKGIIPQYRLISSLRLHPSRKTYRLRTGAAQVRGGQFVLPVRNLGNTIDPIGGSYRISGPASRDGSFRASRRSPASSSRSAPAARAASSKGRYTITGTALAGRPRLNVRTSVTIR